MPVKLPIYLDYNATTPCDPRVFEAMAPYFVEKFGNAASRSHRFGWEALEAVEKGRQQIASLMGASPKDIVFTSGATESDNLAIKGVAQSYREKGDHIITVVTEHKAVLDSCKALQKEGFSVTYLKTDTDGLISPDDVRLAITDRTILVSVMLANNEIGVIQPIAEIGRLCRERGVLFHTDATQGFGKMPFDVNAFNVDLASVTAHKMYGPKGVGALYVRRREPRVALSPLIDGGGHERGMRSGTLNVTGIVGFGAAAQIAKEELAVESATLVSLRERLMTGLKDRLPDIQVNGHPTLRVPGNLNIAFAGAEGESLIMGLPDIALSSGAACTSASIEPSYVLKAIGLSDTLAHSSLRFGLGRFTTEEEVDYAINRVSETVAKLREISSAGALAGDFESRSYGASSEP
ncbi:MAG TPA: IscS subfamily cysteine desulfurase [Blastocatellia bacterium]|nr:IscS subfamily cysteine desulfurase [Blastocatellia bacterium]